MMIMFNHLEKAFTAKNPTGTIVKYFDHVRVQFTSGGKTYFYRGNICTVARSLKLENETQAIADAHFADVMAKAEEKSKAMGMWAIA